MSEIISQCLTVIRETSSKMWDQELGLSQSSNSSNNANKKPFSGLNCAKNLCLVTLYTTFVVTMTLIGTYFVAPTLLQCDVIKEDVKIHTAILQVPTHDEIATKLITKFELHEFIEDNTDYLQKVSKSYQIDEEADLGEVAPHHIIEKYINLLFDTKLAAQSLADELSQDGNYITICKFH